jgi:hypothetical protein
MRRRICATRIGAGIPALDRLGILESRHYFWDRPFLQVFASVGAHPVADAGFAGNMTARTLPQEPEDQA